MVSSWELKDLGVTQAGYDSVSRRDGDHPDPNSKIPATSNQQPAYLAERENSFFGKQVLFSLGGGFKVLLPLCTEYAINRFTMEAKRQLTCR